MSTPILPIVPSGENVYKFLVTLSIGLIAFNLLYPRDKSLEIKKLTSEQEYQVALLTLKIDPVKVEKNYLTEVKHKLDSIKEITKEYPEPALSNYKSRYTKYVESIDDLNIDEAELDHKERLISHLGVQLKYYERLSQWTFIPSIILFVISLFFWLLDHRKKSRQNNP